MGLAALWQGKRRLLAMVLLLLTATGGCKQGPWPLWRAYASRFIDGQGRVIDPQGGGRTTSEGQAYAMFFALVNNDRANFDRLLHWTQDNMASGDLGSHLPGWLWGKGEDGSWKSLDPNPASDADVWMAYTLIEAARLWHEPSYENVGRRMLGRIAATEVAELPGFGRMLLPGPVGFVHDRVANSPTGLPVTTRYWTLNPSYVPLFIFERLAAVDGGGPWGEIAANLPRMLADSTVRGFAMDWVDYLPGDGFFPALNQPWTPQPGQTPPSPVGSYDAIRIYLWAGLTANQDPGREKILSAISGMNAYLVDHGAPPEKVSEQGQPLAQDGPVGFAASVVPYLRAYPQTEKVIGQQKARLAAERDRNTGLYGKDMAYYDQNLTMFATGFVESRFRFAVGGALKVEWTQE